MPRPSIYLSVCPHIGWGIHTCLSHLTLKANLLRRKAGHSPPDDETMAQRCLGTSPRTHSTQAGVTQHVLCRVGETEAQSGAEASQGYTARTQITGKN